MNALSPLSNRDPFPTGHGPSMAEAVEIGRGKKRRGWRGDPPSREATEDRGRGWRGGFSAVPAGLVRRGECIPPLKQWAIVGGPYGTGARGGFIANYSLKIENGFPKPAANGFRAMIYSLSRNAGKLQIWWRGRKGNLVDLVELEVMLAMRGR